MASGPFLTGFIVKATEKKDKSTCNKRQSFVIFRDILA